MLSKIIEQKNLLMWLSLGKIEYYLKTDPWYLGIDLVFTLTIEFLYIVCIVALLDF